MTKLRLVDRFQVATTGLFILLGIAIVVRSVRYHAPTDSYLLGGVFILFGVYRAWFVVRVLRRRMQP